MSYLDKLLEGTRVEWKALGTVLTRTKGTKITAEEMKKMHKENAPLKIFAGGKTVAFFDYNDIPVKDINRNPSIIVKSRGVIEFEYYDKPFSHKNEMWSYYSKNKFIDMKFIFYFLKTNESYFQNIGKKMQMPQISTPVTDKFKIPIPCPDNPDKSLDIQMEIVRILDNLSESIKELTVELDKELKARKKQYEYYRDELFSFKEGEVEWNTLEKIILKSYSGSTPKAGDPRYYENGTIPWLRTQEVKFSDIENTEIKITELALKNTTAKWIPINCVIVAISGATAGRSAINKIPLTTNQHCLCLQIHPEKAIYRYVFHWISLNYKVLKSLGQGARGDLNASIIKNFKIPIPFSDNAEKSLAEQERIVKILDEFDAITKSITEELTKEIAFRNKQYEYYRDLLLNFPKDNVTA